MPSALSALNFRVGVQALACSLQPEACTLTSGAIDTEWGSVDDFGGGTILPGQGQAPAWAKFGSFCAEATDFGPITLQVLPGKLQFSRFGVGNVSWEEVGMSTLVLNRLPGDVDGDGEVAFADFVVLANNFGLQDASVSNGDLNADGQVGFSDFLLLAHNFGRKAPVPGDVDGDGRVDFADFVLIAHNFGRTDALRLEGDLDGD